jgi:predicted small lipoprotein YifL
VIVISRQNLARVAAIGALVAALGLSACGRKGPLDPPPSATHSAAAPDGSQKSDLPGRQVGVGSDGKAVAPPPTGQNRPFILDWLVE